LAVFASDRPGGCGNLDLYVSYRKNVMDDMAWEQPRNLGCEKDGGPNGAASTLAQTTTITAICISLLRKTAIPVPVRGVSVRAQGL
jgi:hypothetical protein